MSGKKVAADSVDRARQAAELHAADAEKARQAAEAKAAEATAAVVKSEQAHQAAEAQAADADCDSTNAQGAKARAISTSAVITAGSSKAITKSVVAAIKIITTTRAQKLSSSINRRIELAIMELMIAIKRHQLEGVAYA